MKVAREGDQPMGGERERKKCQQYGDKYENLYMCLQMSKYCQLFYILRIH